MTQKLIIRNHLDENQNPAGGEARGLGLTIRWQDGPLGQGTKRRAPNGASVEDVIKAAIARLEFYQCSRFACVENHEAIMSLERALEILDKRTARRKTAGIEGTHKEEPNG